MFNNGINPITVHNGTFRPFSLARKKEVIPNNMEIIARGRKFNIKVGVTCIG